ncbi:MAG: restriction endonuclease subunit M [Betaproteobacteria bacterium RIFCSPLOWO2_02_FULL_62_17]|nr:MAG: restriction endonuclease subunit M [Betaproteobacteria bacterium RIFCSPLOWO2_02_FULL_62_17]
MLSWVGKRPLRAVTAFPAQHVESFTAPGANKVPVADAAIWKDWPNKYPHGGLLFHGDNKEVLAHLLVNGFRGQVQLIYIDPPFDSGADYVRKVVVRGPKGVTTLDGEGYTFGEQVQYTDIWANDNYLQFMYERLMLMKELLADGGSIWLHCDWHKSHMLRCLLEEIFGPEGMRGEIVWQRTASRNDAKSFGHVHDTLLYFVKGAGEHAWNQPYAVYDPEYLARYYNLDDGDGRKYAADNLTAAGLRSGSSGRAWRGFDPGADGRHWKYTTEKLDDLDAQGRIYWPKGGKGFPRYKRYAEELPGRPISSIWDDIFVINSQAEERGDYPTQKPEDLLERLLTTTSNPGDLVLDCFIGSGTTAVVAQNLGRRWIAGDINKGAIQTTTKRLQTAIAAQIAAATAASKQRELIANEKAVKPTVPAQLGFTIHRVNDYDLAIQHNEAVNLACEHIGVTRTLADAFFDGTLGSKLVKIVPFGHPLSPADLEDVKRELDARANESRDVVVVCLGKELGVDTWLTDWNRMRKQGDTPNKIEVIELRSDPKYGKFIAHKPAQARVSIRRVKVKDGAKLLVEVKDFISPSIAERLQNQGGLLAPKLPEWRAMVDSVMIDPAHDGRVFNIGLADVPARKQDYVLGNYELPAPNKETTVAVKVTDMLGEEVIVTTVV